MILEQWLDGYVIDIPFPSSFYYFLTPDFLNFCCLVYGVEPPSIKEGFDYMELGCGSGFGISAMAAFYPEGKFYGVDFNPQHISFSQQIKRGAGLQNVVFIEKSFEELLSCLNELPLFDYIVMQGVFAWISHENRKNLMRIVKEKLKPGGIVYIGYNDMCGWSFRIPFQRFLVDFAKLFPDMGSIPKINLGMRWIKRLEDVGANYFNMPQIKRTIEELSKNSKKYLVHEYLNTTWEPLFFTDVLSYVKEAKLTYVGMAEPLWNFEKLIFSDEQISVLEEVRSPFLKEMLKDYLVSLSFRKDIYIKGPEYIPSSLVLQRIKKMKIVLLQNLEDKKYKIELPFVKKNANISPKLLDKIFDMLQDGPKSIGEVLEYSDIGVSKMEILSTICILIKGKVLAIIESIRENKDVCITLNKFIAKKARFSNELKELTVPISCSTIFTNILQRLVYDAVVGEDIKELDSIVSHVLKYLDTKLLNSKEGESTEQFCSREISKCIDEDIPRWERLGML